MPIYHNNPSVVVYVPGYLSGTDPQEEAIAVLHKIYPNADIHVFQWRSTSSWLQARNACNSAAAELLQFLQQYQNCQTILVGHSLGARIVVLTLALAAKYHVKFLQGILLGAALWYKDARIKKAANGVIYPLINIYQPEDLVLKYLYPLTEHSPALGCIGGEPIKNVANVCIAEKPSIVESIIHWLLRKSTLFDRWLYALGHSAETVYLQTLYNELY